MNKFEQLIEYIINDEEDKAKELFHEVVVEKSRDIYESLMAEEETVEESTEETVEEATEETVEEGTEEVAEDAVEESIEEEITDEEIGGDAADDLVDEIEADEEGIALEGEEDEDLEDRVVDLEDKLDELMAEFEELMADQDAEEAPEEEGDMEMGDEAEEEGEEEEEVEMPMESEEEIAEETEEEQVDEAVSLKPVKADNADHATNKTSPTPTNGGAKEKLADAHPAKTEEEKGAPAPKAKELPHGTTEPDPKKV